MIDGPLSLAPWNRSRYEPTVAKGHVESWLQRASHPQRPLAFWIRYAIFSPRHRPDDAFGEVWASFFDGECGRIVVVKESVPLARCRFSRRDLDIRIGMATLDSFHLEGRARSKAHTLRWQLDYAGGEPAALLLAPQCYERSFPDVKTFAGTPDALYRGMLAVDGEQIRVDGWPGTQNHHWSTRLPDAYAWGQVAGFDDAADAYLECATARLRLGGLPLPALTTLLLRVDDEEYRFDGVWRALRASTRRQRFEWRLGSAARGARVQARLHAPASSFVALRYDDPRGGAKVCVRTELAACEVTLERPGKATRSVATAHRASFEMLGRDIDPEVKLVA